jgi:hypothetical protein
VSSEPENPENLSKGVKNLVAKMLPNRDEARAIPIQFSSENYLVYGIFPCIQDKYGVLPKNSTYPNKSNSM